MQRQVIAQWFLPVTCLLYGHRHVKFDKSGCMVMSNNAYHTQKIPLSGRAPSLAGKFRDLCHPGSCCPRDLVNGLNVAGIWMTERLDTQQLANFIKKCNRSMREDAQCRSSAGMTLLCDVRISGDQIQSSKR